MAEAYIWRVILALLLINSGIFIFVLVKKIGMKILAKKKADIRKAYEESVIQFISLNDTELSLRPETLLEKKVLREIILEYSDYMTDSKRDVLAEAAQTAAVSHKVSRYLSSNSSSKQKIGTYLAGEYKLDEMTDQLLVQLDTTNDELLFVTARSLIRLGDARHLNRILFQANLTNRLDRKQVRTLLESVKSDISDFLSEAIHSENCSLQTVALEEAGKRHYAKSIEWIRFFLMHEQKELRVSALKAAYSVGDMGDEDFLAAVFSVSQDPEWEVRAFLAKYLRKIRLERSIEVLQTFVTDQNWYVRHNAAESLLFQGEKGKSALSALLDADDPFARDAARAVLQKEALNKRV
ncbi:hypothetical protein ADIAL_1392 [Alkalibacterium sp. AK22]|uniref:HEAT repeat domain-containing protein n=1 Tax=Alkalibacterium sp. AK22 TaxID=1229520 RepID=UPI000452ED86|nr:HEAT repeat domain-containing protein [Alkalibacterium sp. AK22]EXJ23245.1 hypothetical protein ADIAL_1392 [Alkalibacterium sp. AK22]